MRAGKFRHRITIESEQEVQDANGDITTTWVNAFPQYTGGIPAEWLPGPGREYLSSEATRAQVEGRFVIRYMTGIDASMRVSWDGRVYLLKAPPLVDATARREMTLMVASDV